MDIQKYKELKEEGLVRLKKENDVVVFEVIVKGKNDKEIVVERDGLNLQQIQSTLEAHGVVVSNLQALLCDARNVLADEKAVEKRGRPKKD